MSNWDAFVDWSDEVARDPERRKRVAGILIIAGLVVLGVFYGAIYNAFAGPFPLDDRELAALTDVPFRRYVTVRHGDDAVKLWALKDTGVYKETINGRSSEYSGGYHWLPVGDRKVLVWMPAGSAPTNDAPVEGVLREAESAGGRISLRSAGRLMIDTGAGSVNWALLAALLGGALVGVGVDQLRRAHRGGQAS